MAVTGIIAEYNPFHNGHLYQLQKIKEQNPSTKFICVMSGSFTQRGNAAILNKWQRASLAVAGGIDLVLELPFVFAVRSAQDFARGGTMLLERLGLVDQIAFSTEYPNLAVLQHIAAQTDHPDTKVILKQALEKGLPYAAALSYALATRSGISEDHLKQPNTILAIEYLRSLQKLKSSMQPLLIQRAGAGYHEQTLDTPLASASAIRLELHQLHPDTDLLAKALPEAAYKALLHAQSHAHIPSEEYLFRPVLSQLLSLSRTDLQNIYGINEGLENRLLKAAATSTTLAMLLAHCKSKRYPHTRLQRLLLYLLLHLEKDVLQSFDHTGPLYARVLAFNKTGQQLLHNCKQTASIPLIAKTSHFLTSNDRQQTFASLTPLQQMLAFDTLATDLYGLCFSTPNTLGLDFLTSPAFIRA